MQDDRSRPSINAAGGTARRCILRFTVNDLDKVDVLLKAGADPNAPGEYGERPLQVAMNCENPELVEKLLRVGAQLDLEDDKGPDAWQYASVSFQGQLQGIVARYTRTRHTEGGES